LDAPRFDKCRNSIDDLRNYGLIAGVFEAIQQISERRSFRVELGMAERVMPQEGAAQRMQI
jgi:hypothetical protein